MDRNVFQDRLEQHIKQLHRLLTHIELYSITKKLQKVTMEDCIEVQIEIAIKNIEENCGSLNSITNNIISQLPVHVLRNKVHPLSLEQKWYLIPQRKRAKIQDCLPCHIHNPNLVDQLDGPPPAIRNCVGCNKFF